MAGRIRDEDVAYVKSNAPIAEIIGDYVQLRSAGGGQLKGLCPFHDEKSPSFHVTPSRGYFHCFGCQVGGDVISFVMKMEHTSFSETVERLADRMGFTLTYVEGGSSPRGQGSQRARLIGAHKEAAEYYQANLSAAGSAQIGRDFLKERGFDQAAAHHFSVGYALDEWDALTKHLQARGFTVEELLAAGLAKEGQRGPIDRFRHRLVWPIRDLSGDVVGFGARKLSTDPQDTSPKYLNSPETAIYKKNQVLYGLDLAKKEISRTRQAVVVEGYTDVMAAHLAGVTTAVATCGTAFGEEHVRILRRLLMDDDAFRGEVIFTFDGDEAGQKAALKAFDDDQRFVAQTFVAVEPNGMDPCELRQAHGDEAVRELVAKRVPLFEFAMRSTLRKYDLERAEGRVGALTAVAPLIGRIRDRSLQPEYIRAVAGWLGMDLEIVRRAVRDRSARATVTPHASNAVEADQSWRPDRQDPRFALEREALKAALQGQAPSWTSMESGTFAQPAYAAIHQAMLAVIDRPAFDEAVLEQCVDDRLRSVVTELLVEPLLADADALVRYGESVIARVREQAIGRTLADVKSRLQRVDASEDPDTYHALFAQLMTLEAERRDLREQAVGELG